MTFHASPPDHPAPRRLAWVTSLAVHALFAAAAAWLLRDRPAQGAAEEQLRVAGISLIAPSESEEPSSDQQDETTIQPELSPLEFPRVEPAPADEASSPDASPPAPEPDATAEAPPTPGPGAASTSIFSGSRSSPPEGDAGSRRIRGDTTVSVFGLQGEGVKFVYLFDRSDSMQGAPIAALKRELIASLDALRSVHQFHIIFFNHQVSAWHGAGGRVSFATDGNKRDAARFVNGIAATGGTYRWDALRQALALAPDVIFFLTDTDNQMPDDEVAKAIDRAERRGIAIQAIEFGHGRAGRNDNFLRRLARETGGQYVYINTSDF